MTASPTNRSVPANPDRPARRSIIDLLLDLAEKRYLLGINEYGKPYAIDRSDESVQLALTVPADRDRLSGQIAADYRTEHDSMPDRRYRTPLLEQVVVMAERAGRLLQIAPARHDDVLDQLTADGLNIDAGNVPLVRGVLSRLSGRDDVFVSGYSLTRPIRNDRDDLRLVPMDRAVHLRNWTERQGRIPFYRVDPNTGAVAEEFMPVPVADLVLGRSEYDGVHPVVGLARIPVVRPDGSIALRDGYDPATRLYLDVVPSLRDLPVPDDPTANDVVAAGNVLREIVDGFPFGHKDDPESLRQASRANAIGLLISPALKTMYPRDPIPAHVITAAMQGSGKSLLADRLPGALAGGSSPLTYSSDEREMRKLITAQMMDSPKMILAMENILPGTILESGVLAQFLTQDVWEDRVLGANRKVSMNIDRIVTASGNNLTVGPDLAARSVPIIIDPNTAHPEARPFSRNLDDAQVIDQVQPELMTAVLTLVRRWALDGCPPMPPPKRFRQFTRWAGRVGAILAMIGVAGHLANLDALRAVSDDELSLAVMFEELGRQFGVHGEWTAAQMAAHLRDVPDLLDQLPILTSGIRRDDGTIPASSLATRLGTLLRQHAGQFHGGFRIDRRGFAHRSVRAWSITESQS